MTDDELRQLLEAQAATARGFRAALFTRLAATSDNVPHGTLAELAELKRLAPIRFARILAEVGVSFTPRHAAELVAGLINRLQHQGSRSTMYASKAYREVLGR